MDGDLQGEGVDADDLKELEERVANRVTEQILVSLPNIIHHLIGTAASMRVLSNKFYDKHKDLADHKMEVARAIEAIQANNPGMKLEKLMEEAVPLARERIKAAGEVSEEPMSRSQIDQELGNL